MKPYKDILTHAREANRNAERAYWWMKDINRDEARRLGLSDMVQRALALLLEVDSITMDIQNAISRRTGMDVQGALPHTYDEPEPYGTKTPRP